MSATSPPPSLARRLVVGAAIWSVLVLILGGYGLSSLYRASALRALDRDLENVVITLLRGVDTDSKGAVSVPRPPNDSRFEPVYSGRYWGAAAVADGPFRPLFQSRSVWDAQGLWPGSWARPGALAPGRIVYRNGFGPDNQRLRVAGEIVRLPDRAAPVLLLAAADRGPVLAEARKFTAALALSLAVLCGALIAAVLIQVRIGLAPLRRLSDDLKAVRRGDAQRLAGAYPGEVAPLAAEVNALIDANREVVERAKTHVGNLAHALKTPISVLLNEAREQPSPLAAVVRRQAEAMSANVSHYLKRAQAAARAETARSRTDARAALDELTRVIGKLYARERGLVYEFVPSAAALSFRGERQDLDEMVGNLLDNAGKWAKSRVRIGLAAAAGERLEITVEDDGPGLAPEERAKALKRGVRLDETAPGTGLGLAIVDELARAHGGSLTLERAALGGLKAALILPAAG